MVSTIPFEQILSYARAGAKENNTELALIPASIYECLGQGIPWIPIPNWSEFEQGNLDFDSSHLVHLFATLSFEYLENELIVVTDEEWVEKEGFVIRGSDLEAFMDWYSERKQMDFWQPLDYVFFNCSSGEWFLIHHEGMAVKVRGNPSEFSLRSALPAFG